MFLSALSSISALRVCRSGFRVLREVRGAKQRACLCPEGLVRRVRDCKWLALMGRSDLLVVLRRGGETCGLQIIADAAANAGRLGRRPCGLDRGRSALFATFQHDSKLLDCEEGVGLVVSRNVVVGSRRRCDWLCACSGGVRVCTWCDLSILPPPSTEGNDVVHLLRMAWQLHVVSSRCT